MTDQVRVVVAEDEEHLREALAELLDVDPCLELVGTAGDAQKAIDLCRSRQPDALLLDVRMPRGGGQRVIAELRDELPDLRVVVLSATDDAATRRELHALGADDYLVKGTGSGDILASLKSASTVPMES